MAGTARACSAERADAAGMTAACAVVRRRRHIWQFVVILELWMLLDELRIMVVMLNLGSRRCHNQPNQTKPSQATVPP